MIKVKDTKVYKRHSDINKDHVMAETLVAEGQLVIIIPEHQTGDPGYFRFSNGIYFKPILISLTEKIEVGDLYYSNQTRCINESAFNGLIPAWCFKILALPENFSPQQLQDIIDGKLKDGDKVLVECFKQVLDDASNDAGLVFDFIKPNPQSHVTIHKAGEKMYTKEQVIAAYEAGVIDGCDPDCLSTNGETWFEENVK